MAEDKTIEEYLEELREINRQLQKEDVKMDDALRLYETGARLAKQANGLLDSYEKRISEIEAATLTGGSET